MLMSLDKRRDLIISTKIKVKLQTKTNTVDIYFLECNQHYIEKGKLFPFLFLFLFFVFQVLSITAVSKVTRHLISG